MAAKTSVPPPPPWNDRSAGVPRVIEADADGNTSAPIRVVPPPLDEETFVRECALRLNMFLRSYPKEARHVLAAFLPYEHELAEVCADLNPTMPPGSSVAALFAGVLQSHAGRGWELHPVFGRDEQVGTIILRFDVIRQTPIDDEPH